MVKRCTTTVPACCNGGVPGLTWPSMQGISQVSAGRGSVSPRYRVSLPRAQCSSRTRDRNSTLRWTTCLGPCTLLYIYRKRYSLCLYIYSYLHHTFCYVPELYPVVHIQKKVQFMFIYSYLHHTFCYVPERSAASTRKIIQPLPYYLPCIVYTLLYPQKTRHRVNFGKLFIMTN